MVQPKEGSAESNSSAEEYRESCFCDLTTSRQYYSGIGVETVLETEDDGKNDGDLGEGESIIATCGYRRFSVVEGSQLEALSLDDDHHQSKPTPGVSIGDGKKSSKSRHHTTGCSNSINMGPKERREHLELSTMSHSFPCKDQFKPLPSPPTSWPQRPLMIRPTPHTSTKIIGIRRARGKVYENFGCFCTCCILPINNGMEKQGESLVVDFESTHFVGTMMLRIKQASKIAGVNYSDDDGQSYFAGKKRRFQVVVKGRFKTPLAMSQCVTGQTFDRPAKKLPAKFIVSGIIKIMTTLAPQLEATIESRRPRFLTPLVSTAHTILVKSSTSENIVHVHPQDMEFAIDEPSSFDESSIMRAVTDGSEASFVTVSDTSKSSIASRMKARKKVFNALAARKSTEPKFQTTNEYTFEFYQHLLDFGDELAIDVGSMMGGKVGLAKATDGQPLKILAAYRATSNDELDSLWSFDVWHESLYPHAEASLKNTASTKIAS